jgi:hypothetical protein
MSEQIDEFTVDLQLDGEQELGAMLNQLDEIKKVEESADPSGPESFYIKKPTYHESPNQQLDPAANQTMFVTPPEDQVEMAGENAGEEAEVEPFVQDTPLKQRVDEGEHEFAIRS